MARGNYAQFTLDTNPFTSDLPRRQKREKIDLTHVRDHEEVNAIWQGMMYAEAEAKRRAQQAAYIPNRLGNLPAAKALLRLAGDRVVRVR
jgi:hypothetical protein